jgi:hypothetical protein
MATLRITETFEGRQNYRAEIAFEDSTLRRTAHARFEFNIDPRIQERVRWYLEDYLEHPLDPASSDHPPRQRAHRRHRTASSAASAVRPTGPTAPTDPTNGLTRAGWPPMPADQPLHYGAGAPSPG